MTDLNGDNKVNDFTQVSNWQFQNLLLKPVLEVDRFTQVSNTSSCYFGMGLEASDITQVSNYIHIWVEPKFQRCQVLPWVSNGRHEIFNSLIALNVTYFTKIKGLEVAYFYIRLKQKWLVNVIPFGFRGR